MIRRQMFLLLLTLAAVFFWPMWFAPEGFLYRPNSVYSDLTVTHWPNAIFIRHSLEAWGQIPLWRPLILGGEPFAANPLSGLWYPPNLLLLILPLAFAFNLLFVLHTAWAGWGGYLLTRSMGASRAGGLLAAITLMFAPKAVVHLASGHVGLYYAWAWLPWTLWAVRRLAARGRPGDIATAAGTATMLVLADVRLGFYGGLAAAGYWLWGVCVCREENRRRIRAVGKGVAAALLVAALTAVQAVPLAVVAGRLNRGGLSLEESGIASMPPGYLVGLLVADHGGFQEWMTYVGAVGLLLALVGLACQQGAERWWWGCVALAAAVYSLGIHTPIYSLLYQVLPPLGWVRGPARAWFLVVLAVAVLGALGLTAAEEGRRVRPRWAGLAAAGLIGAAMAGGVGGSILRLPANVVVAAVIWPLAGLLIALRTAGRLRGPVSVGLVLLLALADLWVAGFTLYRVRPTEEVLAEGEQAAAWLATQPRPFRVYSPSYSIPQHTAALYDIEMVDGVDPFQLASYVDFMRAATGVDLPGYSVTVPSFPELAEGQEMLLAHRGVVPDLQLLGLLNVRYLAAGYPMEAEGLVPLGELGGVYLHGNEKALPRAFVVERVEAAEGLGGALDWLVLNDPDRAAVVDGGPSLGGPEGIRVARVLEWTPNRVRIEAEGPGLLVLSEIYDLDWRAEVDGEAAEVARTNGILRGVYLGEGQHQVRFVYWPAGLWAGCAVTAMGLICAAALWATGWWRERRCR